MQYTKKFDRLLFLRPDFFKVDLFFFLNLLLRQTGLHQKFHFDATPFRYVRMSKMQGAEDEDDRSLLP